MSIVSIVAIIVIVALILVVASLSYVKAPPDQAFLISGPRKDMKIISGQAGFKVPFIDRLDKLYLGIIGVDVKTKTAVPTADFINVMVDANVNVSVSKDSKLLNIAARNFLNQKPEVISRKAQEVLEGNMREIVGQMQLREMVVDRKAFAEKVMENAALDMANLGLEIVSFNIQNFSDENNVITDLGIDNIQQIKKDAAIARSNAEKEIALRKAENMEIVNKREVESATNIAIQNNELDIQTSELKAKAEVKRAVADTAYDINKMEQQKELDVARTNAQIAQAERQVELKKQEIELKEKELDALVRKQADADLYAAQKKAEAELMKRQKEAEAKAYEKVQAAKAAKEAAELDAEAKKVLAETALIEAQKAAEGIRAKAEAEAEGIRQRGLAEAEGIDKKAEAQKKMSEASIAEMYFNAMPQIAQAVAEPLSNIDSITMYGEGNSSKMVSDITKTISQIMNGIKDSTGIDPAMFLSAYAANKLTGDTTTTTESAS